MTTAARRILTATVLAVVLAGCGDDPTTETVPIDAAAPALPQQSGGPQVGDHWHAVYGVYACGDFMEPFESTDDPDGLHSHQDGIIHIHPFHEGVTNSNATFATFLAAMRFDMTATSILYRGSDDPFEWCVPSEATNQLMLLRWTDDDLETDPDVWYGTSARQAFFETDGEVWVLAIVPEGTDPSQIPLPPQERFDQLDISLGRTDPP